MHNARSIKDRALCIERLSGIEYAEEAPHPKRGQASHPDDVPEIATVQYTGYEIPLAIVDRT